MNKTFSTFDNIKTEKHNLHYYKYRIDIKQCISW